MSKTIEQELHHIAGLPADEQTDAWHRLASARKKPKKRIGVLFAEAKAKYRQENEGHAALRLASYIRKERQDISSEDAGDGAIKIPCPINEGETIIVRDAELFFSLPIVERLTKGGYTPTIAEYVQAIAGDDKRGLQYHQIDNAQIVAMARKLCNPEWCATVGHGMIASVNRHAFVDLGAISLNVALEFNERYAKVDQEGQILVFDRRTKKAYKPVEFHKATSAEVSSDDDDPMEKSKVWFNHPAALLYKEVNLYPMGRNHNGREIDCDSQGVFNVWPGFATAPQPGDWGLFKQFIREVICDNNQEHFDYVLGWLAHMVQCPWEKPGVALVLKGMKRIGKGEFARALREMFMFLKPWPLTAARALTLRGWKASKRSPLT